MKIGEVSKLSGVGIETIRFYEKEGLIEAPPRAGKYREYSESVIPRLKFILHAKDLGFSLKEINGLLTLRANQKGKCASVKKKATQKIMEVDKKIDQLTKIKTSLSKLIEQCVDEKPTSECPILDAFEQDWADQH